MKPIGNSPGADNIGVAEPNGQRSIAAGTSTPNSRIRSGKLEDIIGATPLRTSSPSVDEQTSSEVVCRKISEIAVSANSFACARKSFAQLLLTNFRCSFVGWFVPSKGKIGEHARVDQLAGTGEAPDECLGVCKSGRSGQSVRAESGKGYDVCATSIRNSSGDCLVAVMPSSMPTSSIAALELIGARLSELLLTEQLYQLANDSINSAALVELISLVSSESSENASLQRLADELQRHLSAEEVFVGVCRNNQPASRIAAVSHSLEFDKFSESTRLIEAVMQESIARSAASAWPAVEESNRHALLAHQQLALHKRTASVVATPLRSESGDIAGSIVATFPEDDICANVAVRFLHAGSRSLGTAVHAVNRTHRSSVAHFRKKVSRCLGSQKFTAAAVGVCLAVAGLLIPVDYQVRCDTELQPVSRRYVAAPFDAALEKCHVDPGDLVEKDQLLAVLDGRELRWEAAGLRADMGKASKEHNTYLSKQDFGDAAIARHEIDRLKNRSDLLSQRERDLEIRSPVSGIVVSGDLREREGVPLEAGKSLFEVAPLDRLVLEIAIPEEDIRHVDVGMSIRLQLDSRPSETIEATVLRIHPKAELREHENVFIAEAEISNDQLLLRPGMKGSSLVSTGRRAFGWNLFHKPVAHVVGWLGW